MKFHHRTKGSPKDYSVAEFGLTGHKSRLKTVWNIGNEPHPKPCASLVEVNCTMEKLDIAIADSKYQ
jgi:hypothetical protein